LLIPDREWVVDYADITAAMTPLIKKLDHHNLNDILPRYSTAEVLAWWIHEQLTSQPSLAGRIQQMTPPPLPITAIEVRETPTSNVIYRP
jgi:6-pyruvoyltetrahydropterin/6-carboxytetrahydropterin synthase